jgi:hypothetical protein
LLEGFSNARLVEDLLPSKNNTLFCRGEAVNALGGSRASGGRCWPWRLLRGRWERHELAEMRKKVERGKVRE